MFTKNNYTHDDAKKKIDWPLTIAGTILVLFVCLVVTLFPEQTTATATALQNAIFKNGGAFILWLSLALIAVGLYLMCSKYGNIRLGSCKPEYSRMKYFSMMICSGFGAATMYWAFLEVIFYYNTPALNVTPQSTEAAEIALSYNIFHWGTIGWVYGAVLTAIIGYTFYIKKYNNLQFSSICGFLFPWLPSWAKRCIDLIFIIATMGSCAISLGLSIPLISASVSDFTGIPVSPIMDFVIVIGIGGLFTLSSYTGLKAGLTKLASWNIYICYAFLALVFIAGPSLFIIDYGSQSVGFMLNNFFRMSTWTNALGEDRSFWTSWTVFYIAYFFAFAPFKAVFVTKISKGQRLKDMLFFMLFVGPVGGLLIFMVCGGYSIHAQTTGLVDIASMLLDGKSNYALIEILHTLPFPKVFTFLFAFVSILFMATTMDSGSFSLTAVTSKLNKDGDVNPVFRLFWCVLSTAVPLALVMADSPLNTIKTIAAVICVPMGIVVIAMIYKGLKGYIDTFGNMTPADIENFNKKLDEDV